MKCELCDKEVFDEYYYIRHVHKYNPVDTIWCVECMNENTESEYNKEKELEK